MRTRHWLAILVAAVAVGAAACAALASSEQRAETSAVSEVVPADVVAVIGDYSITKRELKQRLLQEVRPQREDDGVPERTVTTESVLREMIAEKAMSMEGRTLGYLQDEVLGEQLERTRQVRLIQMLLTDYVRQELPVTPEEIDAELEAHPELTREQAERRIQTPKVGPVLDKFYAQLPQKYQVRKVSENFAEAARIHQRLLTQPTQPRGKAVYWIMNNQITDDLSEAERNLPLITYEGGQLTLEDWFKALCQAAPPNRPKDLHTPEGVERLADVALQPFILSAEARARGYDQNEEFLRYIRQVEDIRLLNKVRAEKLKAITKPTDDEIKAYYEAHKELFDIPPSVKVDQVWCQDRQTAQRVRKMLDDGAALDAVKSVHSLTPNSQAHKTYPNTEGPFWDDLWQADPNTVVGPIRGFYASDVKWRVVEVLEKAPAQAQPYSDSVKNRVASALYTLQSRDILGAYGAELLDKYPYVLYTNRIWDIDPLEVTVDEPDAD
ncbi:MAG: peptidyl-prolyl cis-trans isomerase [Sedimentisphaerales bacterium]|nr:peptidyl-prolyl cis-trans isomerase [Sedimentisphaerales bacterium]